MRRFSGHLTLAADRLATIGHRVKGARHKATIGKSDWIWIRHADFTIERIIAKGSNPMKKIIGLALLVTGTGLAVWAHQISGSIGSQITEAISGAPTDKVMMMYIGSAVCAVIGLFLLIKR